MRWPPAPSASAAAPEHRRVIVSLVSLGSVKVAEGPSEVFQDVYVWQMTFDARPEGSVFLGQSCQLISEDGIL